MIVATSLSILGLAAGIFLLMKTEREFLGGIFKALSWVVILCSLASIGFWGYKTINCKRDCGNKCERNTCEMRPSCHKPAVEADCHGKVVEIEKSTPCCKAQGDSVVIEKEVCIKMMGKEECDKVCKNRGACVLSKSECQKICSEKKVSCCGDAAKAKSCSIK